MGNIQWNHYVLDGKEEGRTRGWNIRKCRLSYPGYILNFNKKTPKHLTWTNRRSEIEVTVKIPHRRAIPVIELPRFEILAPDFQVTLPNTDNFVNFRDLTIHASNMPVTVGVSPP